MFEKFWKCHPISKRITENIKQQSENKEAEIQIIFTSLIISPSEVYNEVVQNEAEKYGIHRHLNNCNVQYLVIFNYLVKNVHENWLLISIAKLY